MSALANEAQIFNGDGATGVDLLTGLQVNAGQQLLFSSDSSNMTWSTLPGGAGSGVAG